MAPLLDSVLPDKAAGVVFDCDGTLLDSMPLHWQSWAAATTAHGLAFTPPDFLAFAGMPSEEIIEALLEAQGVELQVSMEEFVRQKRDHYSASLAHAVQPIDCVVEVLRAAKAKGLPVAVASGGTREHVTQGLAAAGLLDLVDAVVTAEDVGRGKPAPDGFLLAAEKLGVEPGLCVGYEDAVLGLQAIQAAGFLLAVDVRQLAGYPEWKPEMGAAPAPVRGNAEVAAKQCQRAGSLAFDS